MLERFYRSLYRVRRVEEEVARVYPTDKIKSPVHLSIGQEAVAVGVCEALQREDVVFGSYRSHATYLAKGGDLKRMIAELYGKSTGCARGKGGSMHLIDVEAGVMGASAVVSTTLPQAVGYAYALKVRQKKNIVANFFGDGACDEGAFHESLNFAALKKVSVIFVCENNLYAVHSHQRDRQAVPDICRKVASYGIPTERIDNNDVFRIHERISEAARQLRSGGSGPYFFECMTYRMREHVGPNEDFNAGYRSAEEAEPWRESDAVRQLASRIDPGVRQGIESAVENEIEEAFAFAEASPLPADAELFTDQ